MTTPSRSSLVSLLIPYANSSLFDVREQNVCIEKDGRRGTVHFESNLVKTGNPVKTGKDSRITGKSERSSFILSQCSIWKSGR